MNKKIYNILNKIEKNGYEAYVIGGYVRDYILGINSYDVDITTNATPKDLNKIFKTNKNTDTYGFYKINNSPYNFDITTYRIELEYNNRHPKIEYSNNLLDDLKRRDFTINCILMNKEGEIIDPLNGIEDIRNKKIKIVGNAKNKFIDDPLRILRALRFSIILNFKLDKEIIKNINKYKKLIKTLSLNRIKQEIDKILVCDNSIKGLEYLKKLGILKIIGIDYKKIVKVDDICGMYAQLKIKEEYPFTKKEKNNINIIKKILKYGKIDNTILYQEDLYYTMIAGKIMNLEYDEVIKKYNELKIHNRKNINISCIEICNILNIKPSKLINEIYLDLEDNILNEKLDNTKEDIIDYINNNRSRWNNE